MTIRSRLGYASLLLACSAHLCARPSTFVERPGAIPDQRAVFDEMVGPTFTTAMPIDLTGDGKLDLALHFYHVAFGSPGSFAPCRERLVLLAQNAQGSFVDRTAELLTGPPRLGACMSWHDIADFNGDGRPDIAFAASQEDGRDTSNWAWMNAQSVVMLSGADGRYTLEQVGTPNWYHMVGHVIDALGRPLLAISGFTQGSEVWRRDAAGWTRLAVGSSPNQPPGPPQPYPHVDPGAFVFLGGSAGAAPSDSLVQQAPYPIGAARMDGWLRVGDGNWSQAASLDLFVPLGTVRFVNWQGNENPTQPVYRVDDRDVVSGGFLGGCAFRPTPGAAPIAVFKLSISYIPGGYVGPEQIVHENELVNATQLLGFRVENGSVVRAPLPIDGERLDGINARYLSCADVNDDGLADLSVFRFEVPSPLVYLNSDMGRLRIADETFPPHTLQWNLAGTSLLADFNGDGLADLLRWPGGVWSSQFNNDVSFRYFVATSAMTAHDVFADSFEAR